MSHNPIQARLAVGPIQHCKRATTGTRSGFTLVELLVVITIVLVMMGLMGAALSNARGNQKRQGTQSLMSKLDAVVGAQFASYAGRDVEAATADARAAELRRIATGDLPDRWEDVKFMAANASQFTSRHQQAYIAVWKAMNPASNPTAFDGHPRRNDYAGAECLFLIVMRGGVADCIDCSDLAAGRIGDKDQDGAFEFLDEWGNPIGYILWPGGLQLPADSGTRFFGTTPPFMPNAVGEPLRPLIYSAGPDGEYGFERNGEQGNLAGGVNCGNPAVAPTLTAAAPLPGAADNITNLDAEAKR
jgi:prepilin-type N-terminal cleavage/methylation domain-containing protein